MSLNFTEYDEFLYEEDFNAWKDFPIKDKERWILNIHRIRWDVYFATATYVNELVKRAAASCLTNPVAFYYPQWKSQDWGRSHPEECPYLLRKAAYDFYQAAMRNDFENIKDINEFIKEYVETFGEEEFIFDEED